MNIITYWMRFGHSYPRIFPRTTILFTERDFTIRVSNLGNYSMEIILIKIPGCLMQSGHKNGQSGASIPSQNSAILRRVRTHYNPSPLMSLKQIVAAR